MIDKHLETLQLSPLPGLPNLGHGGAGSRFPSWPTAPFFFHLYRNFLPVLACGFNLVLPSSTACRERAGLLVSWS
jgi:hypothetical protein